jgi:hypothetical protein
MPLPDFFVIAPARSGTTTLHRLLDQHPEIYMCPVKETHFFALEEGKKGLDPEELGRIIAARPYQAKVADIETYRRLFDGVKGEKAIGEACPTYFRSQRAAKGIRHYVPEAKFIAVLRNPVDRAFSAFISAARARGWPVGLFSEIPRMYKGNEHTAVDGEFRFIEGGFHSVHLKRYMELFGKDRIQVHLFDELMGDIQGSLRQIYAFLGVDESFRADTSMRYGVTGLPRSRALDELLKRATESLALRASIRPLLPSPLRRAVSRLRNWNLVKPALPMEARREWIGLYEEDIKELEKLIGRDLSRWLQG